MYWSVYFLLGIIVIPGISLDRKQRACACRGARIPEEGAQRPTSLDGVLGDVVAFQINAYFANRHDLMF